jgi:hypothetical protein
VDEAEEIRGAASRQYPVSRVAHDERAAHEPEGGLRLRLESKLEALDKHQLRTGRAQGLEISIAALKEVIDAIEEMNNRFENAIAMIDVALSDR